MSIDIDELVNNLKDKAKDILKVDVSYVRGFSQDQLIAIAQQAQFVAIGIKSGQITKETQQFFLDSLDDMLLKFANTLRGLMMVTIEKLWNALVQVLWDAISKAASLEYKIPNITI